MGKNLFQYGERFFGSFFPKTVVLLHVVFHTRSIAYDAYSTLKDMGVTKSDVKNIFEKAIEFIKGMLSRR